MPSSEMNFLSPTGRCRSFDAASDGYARGEGALALLLKPMKEAVAARDPIRAIIKGTRLNQDGRTQGITLPSAEAQKQNMKDLYNELGLSPNDIQYVEAHVCCLPVLIHCLGFSNFDTELGDWDGRRRSTRVLCY